MKKNIIALVITATLIGGIGTTAYASVGPNVTKKTYCTDYQASQNEDKLLAQINKKGLINYTCTGGFKDVKTNCFNFIEKILSGTKIVDSTNNTDTNTEEITTPEDTNTQVDSGSGEDSQSGDDTNNSDGVTTPIAETPDVVTPPKTETPVVVTPPKTETQPDVETPPVVQAPSTTPVSDKVLAKVEQMIFQRVNQERAKAGVSALTYNTTMEKYARIKSQDMGDKNYFSHEDLQGNLITVKMKNDGVNYRAWGENIAYIGGVSDEAALATQFMDNWMNSPGHKANILSNNFSSIGVGVYKIGNKVYATQEFFK